MRHTKGSEGTRSCGPYFRSLISVRAILFYQAGCILTPIFHPGSRYIYELYYEKEAISKQLYDWLLKNGYADASLIAKWKKQGYEKVRLLTLRVQID